MSKMATLWSKQAWVRMSPGGTWACSQVSVPSSASASVDWHEMGWWGPFGGGSDADVEVASVACRLNDPVTLGA